MEAFPLQAVAHGERLTVVEHLSELRARLVLSVAVLAVLFAGGLWESRSLLHVLNAPLAHLRTESATPARGSELPQALARSAGAFTRLAHASSLAPSDRRGARGGAAPPPPPPPPPPRPLARAPAGASAGHAWTRRAILNLGHGRLRVCAAPWLAVPAHSAVGVRGPGDRARRPARGAAAPAPRAGALRDRRRVRLLPRPPAGCQIPAGVQPRCLRRPGPGARLLPVRAHDHAGARRDVRDPRSAAGPRSRGPPQLGHVASASPIRPPWAHRPRRIPAGYGPGDHAARDTAALRPLRGHHRPAPPDRARDGQGVGAEIGSPGSTRSSWLRELMPSFVKTLPRWYSTVRGLMKSRAPISGLERLSRASRATCSSWAVRSSRVSGVRLRARAPVASSSRDTR